MRFAWEGSRRAVTSGNVVVVVVDCEFSGHLLGVSAGGRQVADFVAVGLGPWLAGFGGGLEGAC